MRSHLLFVLVFGAAAFAACRSDETTSTTDGNGGGGLTSTTTTTSSGGQGGAGQGGQGAQGGGPPPGSKLILQGTVVTPDISFDGQVLIDGDQIGCVLPGDECYMTYGGYVVDTGGIIAPGFIDTHNHILFDIFDDSDWVPNIPSSCSVAADCNASPYCATNKCDCVANACKYQDHTQWPNEDEYALMLDYKQCLEDASQGKPVWCPLTYDGNGDVKCEMDKWGELKGLVAGTTSIVGLPGNSSGCFGSLSRSIDVSQNDLGADKIQTSALFPPSASSANGVCTNFSDGDTNAYLIHVGEGVNQKAYDEFATLFTVTNPDGCLYAPQTAITHGTAFGSAEFAQMATAGMKLTWSPASNVALYGTTTDIPSALAAGLTISLAPDWSMGGSQNILDELSFADAWDNANWGDAIDTKTLVEMVTSNAAAVLALSDTIGRLEVGLKADVVVIAGNGNAPYDAIVNAHAEDVALVLVGGNVLYGDSMYANLVAPTTPTCDSVSVCGSSKFVCVAEADTTNKLDQTLGDIQSTLEAALTDLDSIAALPAASCNNACAADEACYERTVYPQVSASMCTSACGAGEACFHTAMSGNNQYNCLSINTCYPVKSKSLAPLAPLAGCN